MLACACQQGQMVDYPMKRNVFSIGYDQLIHKTSDDNW